MSGDFLHNLIEQFSPTYYAVQAWWLSEAMSSQPLFMMRAVAGTTSFIATLVSIYNLRHPNELEHTWNKDIFKRFAVISTIKALGFMGICLYYLCAAILEVDRVTSPHRLLVLGTAVSLVVMGYLMDALFWRVHYLRKRSILSKRGEDVQIK